MILRVTLDQAKNILAAYDALNDKNPFFGFNRATQEIVDYLRTAVANEERSLAERDDAEAQAS